jgi:hypothetical protein
MTVYSKFISGLLAECKEKYGTNYLAHVTEFIRDYNKPKNEDGNGKKQYDTTNTIRSSEYTRKSGDEIDMKYILELCKDIFPINEVG